MRHRRISCIEDANHSPFRRFMRLQSKRIDTLPHAAIRRNRGGNPFHHQRWSPSPIRRRRTGEAFGRVHTGDFALCTEEFVHQKAPLLDVSPMGELSSDSETEGADV